MRGRAERYRIAFAIVLLWAAVVPGVLGLYSLWNLAEAESSVARSFWSVVTTLPLQLACVGTRWAFREPVAPTSELDLPPRRVVVAAWAIRAVGWLYALRAIDVIFVVLFYPLLTNARELATGDIGLTRAYLSVPTNVWPARALALAVAALTIGAGASGKAILRGRPSPHARSLFGAIAVAHAVVITSLVVFPTAYAWPLRTNRLLAWYLCRELAWFEDWFVIGAIAQSAAAVLAAGAAYLALTEPPGSGSSPDPEISTSNVEVD